MAKRSRKKIKETEKIEKVEEISVSSDEVVVGGDEKPLTADERAELVRLRRQVRAHAEAEAEKLEGPVSPIGDEKLSPHVTAAAELIYERNTLKRDAFLAKRDGKMIDYEEKMKSVHDLERKAAEHCAKVACVPVERIVCAERRANGRTEKIDYGINVRDGLLRIVLTNGSRLKIDVANYARAKWDYVHDSDGRVVGPNRTPAKWRGRPQQAVLRG